MSSKPPQRGRPPVDDEPILRTLATGRTPTETAAAVGCSVETVYKRLRDPLFNARVHEYRAQELSRPCRKVSDAVDAVLDVLIGLATAVDGLPADSKTRVAASKTVVELALKLRAEVLILPRLAALEAALAEKGIELPMPVGMPSATDGETE